MVPMPDTLIVDDCKVTAKVLSRLMSELGFTVHTAYSAEEAVEFLETHAPPSLFMIDWVMPGMSGVELVSYLREQSTTKGIPVMMVTGQRDMRKVAEALKVGADEYIMKPFSRQIIEDKLRIIGLEPD
jgi:two-component system chemotaxis response regulator CheY